MASAVTAAASSAHAIVMAAAVADWRPAHRADQKQAKHGAEQSMQLERTPDILAQLGADGTDRFLVGFAMETADLEARARAKLERKNLDLIVANDLTVPGAGFATTTNVVTLIERDGTIERLPLMDKEAVAGHVIDRIAAALG
jgi:phosphopantothenoylcysteine decarboxylase/phosphopantothenate--cysteine ligase